MFLSVKNTLISQLNIKEKRNKMTKKKYKDRNIKQVQLELEVRCIKMLIKPLPVKELMDIADYITKLYEERQND